MEKLNLYLYYFIHKQLGKEKALWGNEIMWMPTTHIPHFLDPFKNKDILGYSYFEEILCNKMKAWPIYQFGQYHRPILANSWYIGIDYYVINIGRYQKNLVLWSTKQKKKLSRIYIFKFCFSALFWFKVIKNYCWSIKYSASIEYLC